MLAFSADILSLSAIELSEQLHSRQITAVELLTKTLDRIEDVNPTINAIVSLRQGIPYIVCALCNACITFTVSNN